MQFFFLIQRCLKIHLQNNIKKTKKIFKKKARERRYPDLFEKEKNPKNYDSVANSLIIYQKVKNKAVDY